MPLDSPSITGKHLHEHGSLSIFRSAVAFTECNRTAEFSPARFQLHTCWKGWEQLVRSASSFGQESWSLNDLEVWSESKGKISSFGHQLRKLALSKFLYSQNIKRLCPGLSDGKCWPCCFLSNREGTFSSSKHSWSLLSLKEVIISSGRAVLTAWETREWSNSRYRMEM